MISLRSLGGGPCEKFSAQTLSNWALSRSGKVAILRFKSAFNLRLRGLSSSRREAGTHSDALLGHTVKFLMTDSFVFSIDVFPLRVQETVGKMRRRLG